MGRQDSHLLNEMLLNLRNKRCQRNLWGIWSENGKCNHSSMHSILRLLSPSFSKELKNYVFSKTEVITLRTDL
jgi:hypothetical protein